MDENKITFIDKISDIIIKIDQSVGFKNLLRYVVLILVLFGIFNFKAIVKGGIELVQEISDELHTERLERRDELLKDLAPILQEYRAATGADRILYFEYHNSKENLVGIPFKYLDLVLQNSRYGISLVSESRFKDVNIGIISPIYEGIKTGDVIYRMNMEDESFHFKYPGTYELFDSDVSQAFISIPGITQPVGMIILEWKRDMNEEDVRWVEEYSYGHSGYISRINGLIMSMSY